jgi:dihydrofolate reductase
MSRIVVAEYLTLDGVAEAPETWVFPSWNEELAAFTREQLQASDALLLGRATYDIFAASWPSRTSDDGHAERMNALPKYVVSNTLETAEWNNSSIVRGDMREDVESIKQRHERDILVWGSGTLVKALAGAGLVDEYHLMLFPIVLGAGKRLWDGDDARQDLELVESRATSSGVLILTCRARSS